MTKEERIQRVITKQLLINGRLLDVNEFIKTSYNQIKEKVNNNETSVIEIVNSLLDKHPTTGDFVDAFKDFSDEDFELGLNYFILLQIADQVKSKLE